MRHHLVKVAPSSQPLPREEQLAWKLAGVAAERVSLSRPVIDMIVNRIIDNAGVALASLLRSAPTCARNQALPHERDNRGATIIGLGKSRFFSPEWAAWANSTAVRELDFHDTFLAADYAHPADTIAPLLAVAQALGKTGEDLLLGIAAAYEIQVNLVRSISLHEYKKDHVAHLAPAVAGGLGALLSLDQETIYQAIQQAVHLGFSTRQSRKGRISSWKAFAPAFAGKMAIEAVDRAMRGETSPSPIYEGEDGVLAWMLGGKERSYSVPLPDPGEEKKAILATFTKEHSAEYQAQAPIDLAFRIRCKINDLEEIRSIVLWTSHHTHYVIGSGSGDPQKYDPDASRETLDHSLMYIFAVALEDGRWHHEASYTTERTQRPSTVRLWQKIATAEEPYWTERYHAALPEERAFGARAEITMRDGTIFSDQLSVAHAHPQGERPFARPDYLKKFSMLCDEVTTPEERDRFLELVQRLPNLSAASLQSLYPEVKADLPLSRQPDRQGIF